ncbi:hypothetical protein [Streptomyces rugosispiralis]|uniref:Restriction endonuclease n=1 Tax=Streptomyces rugosispiralis TaxID=2967341 RepID=A0ABT1VBB6_9ACTN|nr:hypothetical protein [Streptomyces rugosispiralis]MCQ8194688.1 hypothetical protein [Streptomyces rugosispiralis]
MPAFLAVLVALGLPLFVIGWLWARLGWWAALLAAGACACGVRAVVLRRREVAARNRRRAVRFTLGQIDAADDREFRRIVGRLLLRDGWTAKGVLVNDRGTVHLVGNDPGGRRMGCAFERGIEAAGQDGPPPAATLRPVSAAPDDDGPEEREGPAPLLLIVSSGAFGRGRVVWAARNNVHLVDRGQLQRWAAGESLRVLLDLDRAD